MRKALYAESPTNQQFPILTKKQIAVLSEKYAFEKWAKIDATSTAVRFCTSWATQEKDVEALLRDVEML